MRRDFPLRLAVCQKVVSGYLQNSLHSMRCVMGAMHINRGSKSGKTFCYTVWTECLQRPNRKLMRYICSATYNYTFLLFVGLNSRFPVSRFVILTRSPITWLEAIIQNIKALAMSDKLIVAGYYWLVPLVGSGRYDKANTNQCQAESESKSSIQIGP